MSRRPSVSSLTLERTTAGSRAAAPADTDFLEDDAIATDGDEHWGGAMPPPEPLFKRGERFRVAAVGGALRQARRFELEPPPTTRKQVDVAGPSRQNVTKANLASALLSG